MSFSRSRAFYPEALHTVLQSAARRATVTYDRSGVPRDPWLDESATAVMTLDPALFVEILRDDLSRLRARRPWYRRWFR